MAVPLTELITQNLLRRAYDDRHGYQANINTEYEQATPPCQYLLG